VATKQPGASDAKGALEALAGPVTPATTGPFLEATLELLQEQGYGGRTRPGPILDVLLCMFGGRLATIAGGGLTFTAFEVTQAWCDGYGSREIRTWERLGRVCR
jgi:hypothetical protein